MRKIAICGAFVLTAFSIDAQSSARAVWCARDSYGSLNCSFTSLAQCRAAVTGQGGTCYEGDSPSKEASPGTKKTKPKKPN